MTRGIRENSTLVDSKNVGWFVYLLNFKFKFKNVTFMK